MNTLTKIIRNSFLVLSTRISIQVLQFVVTIILARLLTPSDFGLVAMVMVIRGFLNVFLTTGFNMALVQMQKTNDDHLQTIFFLTFAIGVVLFSISWFGAPLAADFFNDQKIIKLFRITILGFLIGPFSTIPMTMLSKQLKFLELSKIQVVQALVSFSITIYMAFEGWGPVSIVAGPMLGNIAILPFCYVYFPWFPKFKFKVDAFKELFGFSWKVFATNTVEYFSRNLDNTLIGKYLGATALGFYNLSYNLMMLPLENIAFPVRSILFPAFSKVQGDRREVTSVYCNFLGLVAALVFPAMFGLFIVSDLFIVFAYGDKWAPTIPILKILCLSGMIQAISIPNNSILLSRGRSDVVFFLSIFGLIMYVIGFVSGLPWGIIGVASGYTIANVIVIPVSFLVVSKVASIKIKLITKALISPLVGSLIMSSVLILLIYPAINNGTTNKLIILTITTISGILTYLIYSKMFLIREWRIVIESIKNV